MDGVPYTAWVSTFVTVEKGNCARLCCICHTQNFIIYFRYQCPNESVGAKCGGNAGDQAKAELLLTVDISAEMLRGGIEQQQIESV